MTKNLLKKLTLGIMFIIRSFQEYELVSEMMYMWVVVGNFLMVRKQMTPFKCFN